MQTTSPSPLHSVTPSPQFRVYRGQDPARPTLSAFAEELYVPRRMLAKSPPARPATIAELRSAVNRWCEVTGDPPLEEINSALCADFLMKLRERPGRSGKGLGPDTVKKIVSDLERILGFAGPAGGRCRKPAEERGFFGCDERSGWPRPAPYFPDVARGHHLPRACLDLAQIEDLIAATSAAVQPALDDCPASTWWSAFYRWMFWTGLRRGTAIHTRRSWIRRHAGLVWLQVPGERYKGGRPQAIWLHSRAIAALESVPTGDMVFPWPHTLQHLERLHKRLLAKAGILPLPEFGFHSFRRAISSAIDEIHPDAAKYLLRHDTDLARKHYTQVASQVRGDRQLLEPPMDKIARRHPKL